MFFSMTVILFQGYFLPDYTYLNFSYVNGNILYVVIKNTLSHFEVLDLKN